MLIKMVDGGITDYRDDYDFTNGCPTCDYGSEYITTLYVTLTKIKICVTLNKMYGYALSEGDMIKLFLQNYTEIQSLTEQEFSEWFIEKIEKIVGDKDFIERYEIKFI